MTDPSRPTVEPLARQDARKLQAKGRKAVQKNVSTLQHLKVEYVRPDSIFPNAYNPNRQTERDFELLLSSMTEDGFTQPILVQKKTREIVDGEHRWRAATRLGLDEIPVVFTEMTPEQMRVSTLRHNRARGSEDIELTIEILKDLQKMGALDHAIDSLGMSDREINALIDDLPAPEANASENYAKSWVVDTPRIPEKREVKPNVIESASESLIQAQDRLDTKLAQVPVTNEEARQTILRTETTWHSVIGQFEPEYAELIGEMLGNRPAHRLIQLCHYHDNKAGLGIQDNMILVD